MKFKLDGNGKILEYNGNIPNSTCDIEISAEDYALLEEYIWTHDCYLKDGKVELGEMRDLTPSAEDVLLQKREERRRLLEAFDKWEKAVLRGRENDSEEIMNWYYSLLDLKDEAFIEIPERVQYYL